MVSYELREGILRIDCRNWVIEPSIEDSDACMGVIIDLLREVKHVEKLVLVEKREVEYDLEQVRLLTQIADLLNRLELERFLEKVELGPSECNKYYPERIKELFFLVRELIRKDPVGAWVKLNRMIGRTKFLIQKLPPACKRYFISFLANQLEYLKRNLEACDLIKKALPLLKTYKLGDRRIYREFFKPVIKPVFMFTRFKLIPPKEGYCVERYKLPGNIQVEIYRIPGRVRFYYHITPPEFTLSEEKHALLEEAIRYLSERRPSEEEFRDMERARETYFSLGKTIVKELARRFRLRLKEKEINELASILTRYTTGFGILEVLLADERIQDIYINSPIGSTPIFVQHSDYEECETNLIPTREDAEAWATRFRMYSGRPLDEANPVLDTELIIPGGRARVCAITRTLSPEGLAFAIRRHRERPWTFPLFMKVKMFDPLFAGLMSFIIDGGRCVLIAGGRGSGKTSFLSSMILEIMKKFRVVVLEDSVTGDTEILIRKNGIFEKVKVGELIDRLIERYGCRVIDGREILDSNPENIEVFSLDPTNKIELRRVSSFSRHKVNKEILEVETRTGRRIKVTSDHSLFTLGKDGRVIPIRTRELKVGSYIAVPRRLPLSNPSLDSISLLEKLKELGRVMVCGENLRKVIDENKELVRRIVKRLGYSSASLSYPKSAIQNWRRTNRIPARVFMELVRNGVQIGGNLKIKCLGNSNPIPAALKLDHDFLCFLGLWIADGCYDRHSVIISVVDEDTRRIVKRIGKRFGIRVRMHTDGFSLMLNSKLLKRIMTRILGLKGDAYTKKIPAWVFRLSKRQIAWLLKGIFSGDGYLTKDEVAISSVSRELLKDIQTLLLTFGIVARINRMNRRDKTYSCRISSVKMFKRFYREVGFLQKPLMKKLEEMCKRRPTHDVSDVIPFSLEFKEKISRILPGFNRWDYVCRGYNLGREKLNQLVKNVSFDGNGEMKILKELAASDIFWDQVRSIKSLGKVDEYVYDFSVPGNENFVCENIIAHNTLEIPVTQIRSLGYNIERLKSRSVITRVETELPAEEALRTALRLGDSVLIIGEVRSKEALALYEAMRIGALANLVAGTIHGESAYGVFDRVVHDLGVPPTSFKATDLIVICSNLKSADGLHRFRRITELVEVKKHWKKDPLEEGGFVTLMQYSAKEDRLKPTDVLLEGESFVLNEIARKVREWHANWDAVWDNILLRAKIKQAMLEFAEKLKRPEILEAKIVSEANEMFHLFSEQVRQEVGSLDSKLIYERWLEWFKKCLKS